MAGSTDLGALKKQAIAQFCTAVGERDPGLLSKRFTDAVEKYITAGDALKEASDIPDKNNPTRQAGINILAKRSNHSTAGRDLRGAASVLAEAHAGNNQFVAAANNMMEFIDGQLGVGSSLSRAG